jgi:hypothetical protein
VATEPLTSYKIAVSYLIDGQTKTYTGSFAGRTSSDAAAAARTFVTRYIRPQVITAADEVAVTPS